MAFICNGLSGNGWMRKVGEVFQNQQNQFFFKCISYNCDAKFDSSEELTSHVRLKHADTTNQVQNKFNNKFRGIFKMFD